MATDFSEQLTNFTGNLEGLREFSGLVNAFLEKTTKDYMTENLQSLVPLRLAIAETEGEEKLSEADEKFLRSKFGEPIELTKTDDGGVQVGVRGEAGQRFKKVIAGLSRNSKHKELLYRNCLISLISSAEWLLSQILRKFFEAHPDAAGVKEKSITLEDLRKIGSVADAEAYLITMRVDEIMWGSLEDWIKYLRNTMKLSMGYLSSEEDALIEVFQRRNVMVHNNGVVHQSYITKVQESLREGLVVGNPILVTSKYLDRAINLIEKNFALIAAELWKKLDPKSEIRASTLNKIVIDALLADRYVVAEGVSRFQTEDKQVSEKMLLYSRLNLWQVYKWSGKLDEIRNEISSADFSAKEDVIRLARFVLLDDFESSIPLVEALLESKKMSVDDLEGWPIFKEFRLDSRVVTMIQGRRESQSGRVQISTDESPELSEMPHADTIN